jgi:hypothetical protein
MKRLAAKSVEHTVVKSYRQEIYHRAFATKFAAILLLAVNACAIVVPYGRQLARYNLDGNQWLSNGGESLVSSSITFNHHQQQRSLKS